MSDSLPGALSPPRSGPPGRTDRDQSTPRGRNSHLSPHTPSMEGARLHGEAPFPRWIGSIWEKVIFHGLPSSHLRLSVGPSLGGHPHPPSQMSQDALEDPANLVCLLWTSSSLSAEPRGPLCSSVTQPETIRASSVAWNLGSQPLTPLFLPWVACRWAEAEAANIC